MKFSVARLFFGYELWDGPQYEIGVGVGLHWMKTKAFIEGQVLTDVGDGKFLRGETSINAPLPDIGAWYYYSPASKWLLSARVDWLDASIGDYNGSLWNISAGLDYQFADHWGLGLTYQFFKLDVGVESSDWNGSIKINNNGPLLALTTNW